MEIHFVVYGAHSKGTFGGNSTFSAHRFHFDDTYKKTPHVMKHLAPHLKSQDVSLIYLFSF